MKANETPESRKEKRRPKRTALFFVALFGLIAFISFSWLKLWPETVRREAYLPELEDMARHSPYDGRLLALVGARQIEAHEYKTAAESLRQALAAGEETLTIRLNLAAAMEANGDRPRALAHLRMAAQSYPADAEMQAALARVQKIGAPAPAGVLAPALCPDGPQPLIAAYTKGSILNGLAQCWGGRYPNKSGFTTRAFQVAEHPDDAQAQRLWGLAMMRNRRLIEAEIPLRKAVSLAPQSVEMHLSLADYQEQMGNDAAASLEYIAALKLQRDYLPALLGFGRTSQKGGRIGNAIRSFRRATEVVPTSLEAWVGLARSLQKTGYGYDKSAAAYKTAMDIAPSNTDFFNDYAVSLYHMSRQSEAEAILRQRVQAAPEDALSHYLLGMVLMNTNPTPARINEAESHTREALRLNKGNPTASIQLAQLLFQQEKDSKEVMSLLERAIKLDPYNRNARLLLARVYRRIGQDATADKVVTEADTLFQNQQKITNLVDKERKKQLDRNGREQLAQLYEVTGQPEKAQHQREISALLKADPKAAARIQGAYEDSINQVLGMPTNTLEKD